MAKDKTVRRKEERRNVKRVEKGQTPKSTNPATLGKDTTKKRPGGPSPK